MTKVTQNITRLNYLLTLFQIDRATLLVRINEGLKNALTENDIFTDTIALNHLKRIDKLFNKGLYFYLDPNPIEPNKEASVFFRKQQFNSHLQFADRKIVNAFEEQKIYLSGLSKLADLETPRKLPVYQTNDDTQKMASEMRKKLYPQKSNKDDKHFLKALIQKLADYNILVFEFIEPWNAKEKTTIDGFFLRPNVIVLKRQFFKREIFTLAHELAHYLFNEEEVESLFNQNEKNILSNEYVKNVIKKRDALSTIEKKCNEFAFQFLAGDDIHTLNDLDEASAKNDYHRSIIKQIADKTHLSRMAIYTHLLFCKKISPAVYFATKKNIAEKYEQAQAEKDRQKELNKQAGIKLVGGIPKPIQSPLLVSTIQNAFYEGVIDEYELCKSLHIKAKQIEKYIS